MINPYAGCRNRWMKAALHLHTTASDGAEDLATTISDYRRHGFGIVAATDHDVLGAPDAVIDGVVVLQGMERTVGNQHVSEIGDLRVFNHPSWHLDHWSLTDVMLRPEFHAIEIYNALIETEPGQALATPLWDQALSTGRRLLGIAADDAHAPPHRNRAWTCVDADPDPLSVREALRTGRCYASSGVTVQAVTVADGSITVTADEACEFRFIAERGRLRHRACGTTASYTPKDGDGYVRIELHGAMGRCAWTNPIWLDDEASTRRIAAHANWLRKHLGLEG